MCDHLPLQEYVQRLSEAHYVDGSELGIPRAEQDADGELLLGVCKRCQATRLLSSLEEHEASCKPEQDRARQPSTLAPLPAASECQASLSQVPVKRFVHMRFASSSGSGAILRTGSLC